MQFEVRLLGGRHRCVGLPLKEAVFNWLINARRDHQHVGVGSGRAIIMNQ